MRFILQQPPYHPQTIPFLHSYSVLECLVQVTKNICPETVSCGITYSQCLHSYSEYLLQERKKYRP